jgi:hypothetical protein
MKRIPEKQLAVNAQRIAAECSARAAAAVENMNSCTRESTRMYWAATAKDAQWDARFMYEQARNHREAAE